MNVKTARTVELTDAVPDLSVDNVLKVSLANLDKFSTLKFDTNVFLTILANRLRLVGIPQAKVTEKLLHMDTARTVLGEVGLGMIESGLFLIGSHHR